MSLCEICATREGQRIGEIYPHKCIWICYECTPSANILNLNELKYILICMINRLKILEDSERLKTNIYAAPTLPSDISLRATLINIDENYKKLLNFVKEVSAHPFYTIECKDLKTHAEQILYEIGEIE